MFISVENTNQKFLIREILENGGIRVRKEPFNASLYLKSKDDNDGIAFKTGAPLKEFKFESNSEFYEFKQKFESSGVYGDINPIFQFLSNYNTNDELLKYLNPWSIDIEVYATGEFPTVERSHKFPIVAITVGDMLRDKYYSFVYDINGKLTLESKEDWQINVYDSEKKMLNDFLDFWKSNLRKIHLITGWNSEVYDIPYIVTRLFHIFEDENKAKMLSPFNYIQEKRGFGKAGKTYKIMGLPHLDYLKIFKKFNFQPRSSYSLENIAQDELGYGKLDHSEYGSFANFYNKNINKYIEYNFKDVKLIKELDDKFKYISLAVTIALLCNINYENVMSPIKCWEGILYNKLKKENIVIPLRIIKRKESYMGAFVADPLKGLQKDIISYDLTSLYPSVIRALNCSPETLIEFEKDENATIESFLNGYIPTESHKQNRITDAAGNIYSKDKVGIIPILMKEIFIQRKFFQKIARDKAKELDKLKRELKELIL